MASPLLWLLGCVCAGATELCPAAPWQSWSSLGLATGPVVPEHRRGWAGISVLPAPDPPSPVCCAQGCRGLVLSLWCWGWWGCELGSGHTGRVVPCQEWALGRTGCSPACPRSQWLLVPWHSRAAAAATAPHAAQTPALPLLTPCPLLAHSSQVPPGAQFGSQMEGDGGGQLPSFSLPPCSFRVVPCKTPGTLQEPLEWEYPYLTCIVRGVCAPSDAERPSPTLARHNSNASAHHEPSLEEKGKYPPAAQMGMSLPVCCSRALFPVTFKA